MPILSFDYILSADKMAGIHEQAFADERPWTSEEFENLISQPSDNYVRWWSYSGYSGIFANGRSYAGSIRRPR
jgi:hypothetical protein